jgi:hypothetical protein
VSEFDWDELPLVVFDDREMIYNNNMELDNADWLDRASPVIRERSDEQAKNGTYSQKIETDSQNAGIKSTTFRYPIIKGKWYEVTASIYSLDGSNIRIVMESGDGTSNDLFAILIAVQDEWNTSTHQYRAKATGNGGYLKAYCRNADVETTFYLDEVSLKQIKAPETIKVKHHLTELQDALDYIDDENYCRAQNGSENTTDEGQNTSADGTQQTTDQGSHDSGHDETQNTGDNIAELDADQGSEQASDQAAQCTGEQTADKAGDEGAQQQTDNGAEEATDDAAEQQTQNVANEATDDAAEKQTEQGAEEATDDAAEKQTDQGAEEASDEAAQQQTEQGAEIAGQQGAECWGQQAAQDTSENINIGTNNTNIGTNNSNIGTNNTNIGTNNGHNIHNNHQSQVSQKSDRRFKMNIKYLGE